MRASDDNGRKALGIRFRVSSHIPDDETNAGWFVGVNELGHNPLYGTNTDTMYGYGTNSTRSFIVHSD